VKRVADQSYTNNVRAVISWDTVVQDDVSAYSAGSPTVLTVPTGYTRARVTAEVNWQNNNNGFRYIYVVYNGTTIRANAVAAVAEANMEIVTDWLTVTPGQTLSIEALQGSGSTINLSGTGYPSPSQFQIEWGLPGGGGTSLPVTLTTPDLSYCWDSSYLNLKASSGYVMGIMANGCPWNIPYVFVPSTAGTGITVDSTTLNGNAVVSSAASTNSRYIANLVSANVLHNSTIFAVVNMASFSGYPDLLAGNTNALEFRINTSGYPELVKSFVANIGDATTALTTGTWAQINATYNDSTGAYAFRVAKAAAGSGTNVQGISSGSDALFWNPQTNSGDFNGKMAFFAIYNRILTLTEIQAIEAYITSTYGV